jgi:hypothetical protein
VNARPVQAMKYMCTRTTSLTRSSGARHGGGSGSGRGSYGRFFVVKRGVSQRFFFRARGGSGQGAAARVSGGICACSAYGCYRVYAQARARYKVYVHVQPMHAIVYMYKPVHAIMYMSMFNLARLSKQFHS